MVLYLNYIDSIQCKTVYDKETWHPMDLDFLLDFPHLAAVYNTNRQQFHFAPLSKFVYNYYFHFIPRVFQSRLQEESASVFCP